MLFKTRILENFPYSLENTLLESLFNKVAGLRSATLLKRDSNVDVFCEYYEIFKSNYLTLSCILFFLKNMGLVGLIFTMVVGIRFAFVF